MPARQVGVMVPVMVNTFADLKEAIQHLGEAEALRILNVSFILEQKRHVGYVLSEYLIKSDSAYKVERP